MKRDATFAAGLKVTFPRVLRSEYIKVRSLRSSWILLLSTIVISVGIPALFAYGATRVAGTVRAIPPDFLHTIGSSGIGFSQLIVASFGAVFIGGEYGTGMIRSTMTAVPNRWSPLVAKAIVLAVVSFIIGIVSGFIAFFVAQPILATKHLDFPISTDGVIGSNIGLALYLVVVSLMGLAIGSLLRNSAAAVVVILALLLVIPPIIGLIPLDFFSNIYPYLPNEAGNQMILIDTFGDTLNQWQGGLVATAWAAVLFVAAIVLTKVRDV